MFNKIFNTPFFRVFSYNGIVILGRLLATFVVSKVSAIFLGPSGYAIVGNFKNILQGIFGISSTGFQSGVIKYVTENKGNKEELKSVVTSIVVLSVFISVIIGLPLFIFSEKLSVYVLRDARFKDVLKWLALSLPFISLNFITVYIINGLQRFKLYTKVLTFANILNAGVSFILIFYLDLRGALFASIFVPVLSFFSFFFFNGIREIYIGVFERSKQVSLVIVKSVSDYLFMAIYSSVLISLSYLFIRNEIIDSEDTFNAGLWEAMNKISSFYMVFFSSLFTLYLLPQLTLNRTLNGYSKIMKDYFKYLIPLVVVLFFGLYFFRTIVIKLVLTDEFESIKRFFIFQLLGDFIKIIAFSLAYQFHAKKMLKFYYVSDLILYGTFYFLSVLLIDGHDLFGVYYAYIASVTLYLLFVVILILKGNSKYLETHAS